MKKELKRSTPDMGVLKNSGLGCPQFNFFRNNLSTKSKQRASSSTLGFGLMYKFFDGFAEKARTDTIHGPQGESLILFMNRNRLK